MLTVNEFRTNYNTIKNDQNIDNDVIYESVIEFLSSKFPEANSIFNKFDDVAINQVKF